MVMRLQLTSILFIPTNWDDPATANVLDNGVWWNGTVPVRQWDEESAMQFIQGTGSDGVDEDPLVIFVSIHLMMIRMD